MNVVSTVVACVPLLKFVIADSYLIWTPKADGGKCDKI